MKISGANHYPRAPARRGAWRLYCFKCTFLYSFSSNCGVIQGCNLSPTLANLFQNNLHDIFDSECDQICLDGQSFSSLSFADDLVLISTSAIGLQVCLNKLENYCKRWRLAVNVKKER